MATYRAVEATVRGCKYRMAVDNDYSITISRQRPGFSGEIVGRGDMTRRPGEPERYARIECAADLGDDVSDALYAAWFEACPRPEG